MSLRKKYGTDKSKVNDGVWSVIDEYEKDGETVKARVRLSFMSAATNKKFEKTVAALSKPYRRQIANNTIDPTVNRQITIKAFTRTIIKDWENVVLEEGGEALPFNEENVVMVMTELPELYDDLLQVASDRSVFGVEVDDSDPEADEDAAKNSVPSTDTSSNFPTVAEAPKADSNGG